ncbi:type VII secretion target [Micromonospora endolithica]|uniref:ESX-1 secretion-associated protein n=1 Tax=Micromonospora endolithica TaxID=230091 RepID=A0A3A9ZIU9_9ACTN|nr:type VII secretion target [Micromonospora endolithica]RKN47724.1 ESX-1 secretion-associated protein [Micromonospora endolithica]TWJ21396.1 excreted virulence factor EspC (type VII ESX diderm) [Micromonospora endolithica]
MPTGDGIRVDPDDLIRHAARIDRSADDLDTARQAGQHVRLDTDAYGQLCAIMPLLLDGLQRTLVDGIGTAAGSVRDTAGRLRASAASYRASDVHADHLLRRVRDDR